MQSILKSLQKIVASHTDTLITEKKSAPIYAM